MREFLTRAWNVLVWAIGLTLLVVLVAGAGLGAILASSRGLPRIAVEPEVIAAEPAAAKVVETKPVAVTVLAPRDSTVGDLVTFGVEVEGDPRAFTWSVDPPVDGLMAMDGGRKAVFANRVPGDYLVICSAADAAGHVAHDTHQFTLLPPLPENPVTAESLGMQPKVLSLAELMRRWVAEVPRPTREAEALIVAGSFHEVAVLLENRAVDQGTDPLLLVEEAAERALGPQVFAAWQGTYFAMFRSYLQEKVPAANLRTSDQWANALHDAAVILEAISGADVSMLPREKTNYAKLQVNDGPGDAGRGGAVVPAGDPGGGPAMRGAASVRPGQPGNRAESIAIWQRFGDVKRSRWERDRSQQHASAKPGRADSATDGGAGRKVWGASASDAGPARAGVPAKPGNDRDGDGRGRGSAYAAGR